MIFVSGHTDLRASICALNLSVRNTLMFPTRFLIIIKKFIKDLVALFGISENPRILL